MKKKIFRITLCILFIIILLLIIFPFVKIKTENKLIIFSYSDDVSKYESYGCYDESYFYNEDMDVSFYDYNFEKFLIFHKITLGFKKGNVCETEYLLEEEYINNFVNNAKIEYNNANLDIAKLIKGKRPIVQNKRYFGNEYDKQIDYVLDGKYETMYVFYLDDLLVIQVGLSDEGPKFIAYK